MLNQRLSRLFQLKTESASSTKNQGRCLHWPGKQFFKPAFRADVDISPYNKLVHYSIYREPAQHLEATYIYIFQAHLEFFS